MISWTLPSSYIPDAFRINIYDRSTPPLPNGVNNTIHRAIISPTSSNYTVPTILSTGVSLVPGDKYTIEFQMITTRDGGPNSNNSNADDPTRSSSYWSFTPEPSAEVSFGVALPMIDGATGVFHFNVGGVGPELDHVNIDPTIAARLQICDRRGRPESLPP